MTRLKKWTLPEEIDIHCTYSLLCVACSNTWVVTNSHIDVKGAKCPRRGCGGYARPVIVNVLAECKLCNISMRVRNPAAQIPSIKPQVFEHMETYHPECLVLPKQLFSEEQIEQALREMIEIAEAQ